MFEEKVNFLLFFSFLSPKRAKVGVSELPLDIDFLTWPVREAAKKKFFSKWPGAIKSAVNFNGY